MKVVVNAPAKVNLMLDILARLENGYHSLFMIMQSVDLCDIVTVSKNDSKTILITTDSNDIPCNNDNIAYKACESFFEFTGMKNTGTVVHIEKKIPFSAGLAGGSADAAATIVALDKIHKTSLTDMQKCQIGEKVGADVPFCIVGGTCLSQDIGQVLSPLPPLSPCYFVLVKPKQSISTKSAYEQFDAESVRHLDKYNMLHYASKGDFEKICKFSGNVFEQFIEVHERVEIKRIMRECGAICALMSGSGPTIYGIFEKKIDAENCMKKCKTMIDEVFICKPVNHGCKIME